MPIKTTPELREGDIVLNHGMRILIDGPPLIEKSPNHPGVERYAWPGLVLNADELCDPASETYDAYIANHLRGIWWEDRAPRPRKDDWPIVGNHLATWEVDGRRVTKGELRSPARRRVLEALAVETFPVWPPELAKRLNMPEQTVRQVLQRPRSAGWVGVVYDKIPGGRRGLYFITPAGRSYLASGQPL